MKIINLFFLLLVILMPSVGYPQDHNLPLFSESDPIELVLEMDMEKVLNDNSKKPDYHPAFLIQKITGDSIQDFNIKIKARGTTRRLKEVCEFPPLKINFVKSQTKNTVFEGQDKIKMVTHCRNSDEFENYAMLEYLAYKTYNVLTDYSYRVRLVHVVYKDIRQQYPDIEKSGFLLEEDELMAHRIGGELSDKKIWSSDSCDQQTVDLFAIFQFMIGNTDWWIHKRHNANIVHIADSVLFPIPFDFDYAGIVNAPYATPSPELPIVEVKHRFFKGPCKTYGSYESTIRYFNERKPSILQQVSDFDQINKKLKRNAEHYIESFYKIINDPDKFSDYILKTCQHLYKVSGPVISGK